MDIRISPSALTKYFDCGLDGADLATDSGLETAVVISLFTDRRAEDTDQIPDGTADRRGWWGDSFADDGGDRIGSRLWLLGREKQLPSVAKRAETYAKEALQWLIDDGISSRVTVVAEFVRTGVLGLSVEILRPVGTPLTFRFSNLWEAMYGV